MRNLMRALLITAATILVAIGFASPALAHVEVSLIDMTADRYGLLTFRIPTESDTASTIELRVKLPDDHPLLFVDPQYRPGWTAVLSKRDLPSPQTDENGRVHTQYVSQVVWKADTQQAEIPPNQLGLFSIDAGPLPNQASLALPAEQIYSDGSTVFWNEPTVAGKPAPAHPVPVVKLASGTSGNAATPAQKSTPAWPGIAGLVVGIVALLIALASFMVPRRRSLTAPSANASETEKASEGD
jgi:uncharacterized protein YcnI